jgi:hypothetical protein
MTPAGTRLQESLFLGAIRDRSFHSGGRGVLRTSHSMDPEGTAAAPATVGNKDGRLMTSTESAGPDPGAWWPRGWRRLHVVILCFALASFVALIVQRVVPAPATDVALICAVWVTFYPVARLKRTEPWWAHWARGILILIAFLWAQHYFG